MHLCCVSDLILTTSCFTLAFDCALAAPLLASRMTTDHVQTRQLIKEQRVSAAIQRTAARSNDSHAQIANVSFNKKAVAGRAGRELPMTCLHSVALLMLKLWLSPLPHCFILTYSLARAIICCPFLCVRPQCTATTELVARKSAPHRRRNCCQYVMIIEPSQHHDSGDREYEKPAN
jgi:hypothetical protein